MKRVCEFGRFKPFSMMIFVIAFSVAFAVACTASRKAPLTVEERLSDWYATVDTVVTDPQRAEKIKLIGQRFLELKNSMSVDFAEMSREAAELNASYDTTAAEAMQYFEQFEEQRKAALAQYRDLIFAMRGEVSAEEWDALID